MLVSCLAYSSTLKVHLKRRLAFNRLHGLISQKRELFTTTAVRTWNPTKFYYNVGLDVHSAVAMKSAVFWVVTPCSLERARRFGWTCRLHMQSKTIWEIRTQLSACFCWFPASLSLRFWRWRGYVPPKLWVFSQLHCLQTRPLYCSRGIIVLMEHHPKISIRQPDGTWIGNFRTEPPYWIHYIYRTTYEGSFLVSSPIGTNDKHKLDHGSRRGSKPRTTVLARARRNLLDWLEWNPDTGEMLVLAFLQRFQLFDKHLRNL
jgi:hypothetical protein